MASPSSSLASSSFRGILVIRGGFDDGFGAGFRIGRFENARADEDSFGAELHDERGVGRSGDAAGGEVGHGEFAVFGDPFDEFERGLQILGGVHKFFFAEHGELLHLFNDGADVANGFDDVARARFAFSADHGRAFGDAAQGFAQIARPANEGHFEIVLIDVVLFVGGSEHFAFVDVIDAEHFQNARFGEVADADLRHDGDGDGCS